MKEAVRERGIKIVADLSMVSLAYVFTYVLKYEDNWIRYINFSELILYQVVIFCVFFLLDIPKRSWTYTSLHEIQRIIQGVLISTITIFVFSRFNDVFMSPHTYISLFFLGITFCITLRYSYMMQKSWEIPKVNTENLKTLVVGAGEAGGNLLRESTHNHRFKFEIVGLIDDDPRKENMFIQGYKVLGSTKDIHRIVREMNIGSIIIAIPSAPGDTIKRIYRIASDAGTNVKILPAFTEFLRDEPYAKLIRDVRVEDLLGREQKLISKKEINETIEGKIVFITGGGGSIGSELSRQVARYSPSKIVNIDINENTLYFLELELKEAYPHIQINSEICSIKDREKLEWLFDYYKPHAVFHAAAHKHVPLMENTPEEAVKNNIFGTKNLVECAHLHGVERFLLISTDKAVNPTSVMGATKRACEMILQTQNAVSSTKYMAVRFGNVLGSRGSVVPIFKKRIADGKNIKLTHKDITRYFMTIPEAVQLVIEASTIGEGGEIFILDMGKPVKILDLAKNIIELSGLKLDEDVKIDIVGLRPGEKLFEELVYDDDSTIKTTNKKIYISKLQNQEPNLEDHLNNLSCQIEKNDRPGIKSALKDLVKTYNEPFHHFDG